MESGMHIKSQNITNLEPTEKPEGIAIDWMNETWYAFGLPNLMVLCLAILRFGRQQSLTPWSRKGSWSWGCCLPFCNRCACCLPIITTQKSSWELLMMLSLSPRQQNVSHCSYNEYNQDSDWTWKAACTSNHKSWANRITGRNCNRLNEWENGMLLDYRTSWSSALPSFGSAVNRASPPGVEEGAGAGAAACHFATDVLTAYPLSRLKNHHGNFWWFCHYLLVNKT